MHNNNNKIVLKTETMLFFDSFFIRKWLTKNTKATRRAPQLVASETRDPRFDVQPLANFISTVPIERRK